MPPRLADLERLARAAGEILRADFGQQQAIEHKGVIDLVTEADRRSEAYLVGEIRRLFPDHHLVTEESGEHAGEDCCRWFIDPLDGTVNYAHGVPIFSVSLAYAEGEALRLGVVYDPTRMECFSAEWGRGAWLNEAPIKVSQATELDQSLLVTGFPYDIRTNPHNNLDLYGRFALRTQGVRRFGSAALDLCYVACGRLDGFWEISLQPWDLAAGGLIAREAGAKVTNLAGGREILISPCSVVAANAPLHAQMMGVIGGS